MNAQDAESRPRERREPGRGLGGGAAGAAGLDGTRAGRQEGRGRGTGRGDGAGSRGAIAGGLPYTPPGDLGFILNAMKNYRTVSEYLGFKQTALVPVRADRGRVERGRPGSR